MSDGADPRLGWGLRRVINAAGTMTALGASSAVPEAIEAAAAILPWFVETDALQARAGRAIAAAFGTEDGMVTASSSAGVTLAVAACMTGDDPARIGRLPDAAGMTGRVVIQAGHLIDYGAPLDQAIRLSGARIAAVGDASGADEAGLVRALAEPAAAAVYVISHHTGAHRGVPLGRFVALCRARGVPVIVDAASEQTFRACVAAGADLVIVSAHKFFGGLTAGIVAGRADLVRAVLAQNRGIGRGFKVGKEGIAGTIAALEAWDRRDHSAAAAAEAAALEVWEARLAKLPLVLRRVPDPTGNPIVRLRIAIAPGTGVTIGELTDGLAGGERPVMVRDDEIGSGTFDLDPCNLRVGEAEEVADRMQVVIAALQGQRTTGGSEERIESTLPPVFSPKIVPRS